MEWFEKLDYYENPLTPDAVEEPFAIEKLVDDLHYRVESGSMVFIEGPDGVGKSSLLMSIVKKFSGKKRVIFLDCTKLKKNVDIERVMHERYGFFGRLFNLTPQNMILLLDDISVFSKKNFERVKYFFDNNYIRSVVFSGKSYASAGMPKDIQDRIGNRIFRMNPLSEEDSVRLFRERAGNIEFITDEIIKKIYKLSGKSTKRFLENCNKACSYAVNHNIDLMSDSDLKKALGGKRG
ncbi:MAG: AAA family ATPase [bacterium]|nr:AAA family ATPase [bacterium]